ncbi:MAG: hypothetical protein Q6354_03990 [Candidatus Brocadiales bacterium]|nr:hypothetical protein [Candidatus Brocadiales bacterium]
MAGDRQVALQVLKELEGRAVRGEYGLKDNQYSLADLKDAFLRHKKLALKPSTLEGYRQDLELILNELKLNLVSDLRPSLLDTYIEGRLGQVSERTVNLEVQALKQMLDYGVKTGQIANNPIADWRPLMIRQRRFQAYPRKGGEDRLPEASTEIRPLRRAGNMNTLEEVVKKNFKERGWNDKGINKFLRKIDSNLGCFQLRPDLWKYCRTCHVLRILEIEDTNPLSLHKLYTYAEIWNMLLGYGIKLCLEVSDRYGLRRTCIELAPFFRASMEELSSE